MNKHKNLYVWLLISSFLLVSCATPRNPDGTIDACKLTKPPKEAHVAEAGHNWRWFTYPHPEKVPSNYTGCMKGWLGDYSSHPETFIVLSVQYNNGKVSQAESFEPDRLVASCTYDKNEVVIKEYIANKTPESCQKILSTARAYLNWKK